MAYSTGITRILWVVSPVVSILRFVQPGRNPPQMVDDLVAYNAPEEQCAPALLEAFFLGGVGQDLLPALCPAGLLWEA